MRLPSHETAFDIGDTLHPGVTVTKPILAHSTRGGKIPVPALRAAASGPRQSSKIGARS
jgi:hypothetical protein